MSYMRRPSVASSVYKLTMAGEQAGFTIEQMIEMLNAGMTVESLLNLIEWKLNRASAPQCQNPRSSRWVM